MPLDRRCSMDAFEANIRREYYRGKTAKGTQHFAIAMSTLKRACGVTSKERMTPQQVIAAGKKKAEETELGERRVYLRPPGVKTGVKRYQIIHRTTWAGKDIPLGEGFDDEKAARARMAKLKPAGKECYILFDGKQRGGVHGKPIMKKGECEPPWETHEAAEPECLGGCLRLDDLLERAVGVPEPQRREIGARRAWLQWVTKLRRVAKAAEEVGWSKSSFEADHTTRNLNAVLAQFCKGRIPMPHGARKSEASERGRFNSLFEIVLPPKTPPAYPPGLAYTGVPVGSAHGVGTSPSASQFVPPADPARFENYVDGPVIRSRKRGKGGRERIGGGKVVQQPKERS